MKTIIVSFAKKLNKYTRHEKFKIGFSIIFLFLLMPLINAEIETLGTFKQNECVKLIQTCADCTYVNISSVTFPNSSIALGEYLMTQSGKSWSWTFCNTTNIGQYIVSGHGNPDSTPTTWAYDFDITPTGYELSTSGGILYVVFIIASLIIFLLSLYGAIKLPFGNTRNEEGRIIGMNELKYLKIFLFAVSYISLMFIIGLLRGVTYNYINDLGVYRFFNWIFWIMFTLMFPIMVVSIFVALINFVQDKKINKALQRGIRFR